MSNPLPYPVDWYSPDDIQEIPTINGVQLKWSGRIPVPKIGQHISTRANFFFGFLKDGEVIGYAACPSNGDEWLSVIVRCIQYTNEGAAWPPHRVAPSGEINRNLQIYGAEIHEVWDVPLQTD